MRVLTTVAATCLLAGALITAQARTPRHPTTRSVTPNQRVCVDMVVSPLLHV